MSDKLVDAARAMRCQIPQESVKNEIMRIVRYMSVYPGEHLYRIRCKFGATSYWTLTGVQTIEEYYSILNSGARTGTCGSSRSEADTPVWMCTDEVVEYMNEAGMININGDEACATSWLGEYAGQIEDGR